MKQYEGDIRLYVACMAAYNNGILHGCWINADQSAHAIEGNIERMLLSSPVENAEEWAIHDYEGFEGASLDENEYVEDISALASFVSEHGELGAMAYSYFFDVELAEDALKNQYAGAYASLAEFAAELTEQSTEIPKNLRSYIDYEAMARDIAINDVFTIETAFEQVHVFWSH